MDEIVSALTDQQRELSEMVIGLDDAGWAQASACAGWSVADVVLHLAQINEMATGSARGDLASVMTEVTEGLGPAGDIDDFVALMVARDRGGAPRRVFERWEQSCDELRSALLRCSPDDRLAWVVGELAAKTLATTRLAETWIHAGDVAAGLGVTLEPTDRLWHVARLAWRTIPYSFQRAGLAPPGEVTFDLVSSSGDVWTFGVATAPTTVSGSAVELCHVASRRVPAAETSLVAEGPDAEAVLAHVRTWA